MTMTGGRHLVAWTDATTAAGAEEALALLLEHLSPEVRVTVAGCSSQIIDRLVTARPGTDGLAVPPLAAKGDLGAAIGIGRTLRALAPDAIHLNKTEVANLRYVEIVARLATTARIVSVVHHVEAPATAGARALTRRLAATAPATVAVGPALACQLETILGLPPGRVAVIPNALPPMDDPVDGDTAIRPVSRLDGRRLTVGVLARFVSHKAVDHLIAATAAVEGVHLLVGGDGPERHRLEQQITRLGIADRVELLGWVPPNRVLGHCDIVASAARIEGHPLALLDAQRRGLPIVATDVGGVPDIVDHDLTGLLIRPGDLTGLCAAIERLAADDTLRQRMGRAARAAAADGPTPRTMAAAYEELYWRPGPAKARTPVCTTSRPDPTGAARP
jgi:glycosyltransferase involved in cell wall biosynthesis